MKKPGQKQNFPFSLPSIKKTESKKQINCAVILGLKFDEQHLQLVHFGVGVLVSLFAWFFSHRELMFFQGILWRKPL